MRHKNEIILYLTNISLLLLALLLFAFPLVFTTKTTDPFVLPKQVLLGSIVTLALLLFAAKLLVLGKLRMRKTPLDIPLLLVGTVVALSSFLSPNRADALVGFVPFLFSLLSYFLIVNTVKQRFSLLVLLFSLTLSAIIVSMLSFNVFSSAPVMFAGINLQNFSLFGSLLDQSLYLGFVLCMTAWIGIYGFSLSDESDNALASFFRKFDDFGLVRNMFVATSVIVAAGLLATLYKLFTNQPAGSAASGLLLLPFQVGMQTGFATISQDAQRVWQSFLFGSGFGTFATDFTRFRPIQFNLQEKLWTFTFFRSSSFLLELLATTGVLGLAAFLFLTYKIVNIIWKAGITKLKSNPLTPSVVAALIIAFVLPFTPVMQALFFILLGLFAAAAGLSDPHHFFDVEMYFVAFKKGIIAITAEEKTRQEQVPTNLLPVFFFMLCVLFAGAVGLFTVPYVASDVIFQNSLVAASANNGLQTYNDQTNAIKIFPYRDSFYRVYSQTNLAIANSLAVSLPKGASPSAQMQQTIYTLIQQSINAARSATTVSPITSVNWQNLGSIYRSLIGFGQNAESFSITSMQQAIVLDPNNPQLYLTLGGIYYQLGQWDNAQREFQVAINLKPDFANAYYNLGHALEQKGDLQGALTLYQTVQTLVRNTPADLAKVNEEIEALQKKIVAAKEPEKTEKTGGAEKQPPLEISTPVVQLPEQKPPVTIPAPVASPSAQ